MSVFKEKKTSLLESSPSGGTFEKAALKVSSEVHPGNGALKYNTSQDPFLDNFASAAHFLEPRSYEEVEKDMQQLWSINPLKALKLILFFRGVSRDTSVPSVEKDVETLEVTYKKEKYVFKGQGLKHEGLMRMLWLAINHKNAFLANLPFYVAVASWKDVFMMLEFDLQYHGWAGRKLPWYEIRKFIYAGLSNPDTCDLVKKYLPSSKSVKKCHGVEAQSRCFVAKYLANGLFADEVKDAPDNMKPIIVCTKYRELKSSGTAHEWQQLISKKDLLSIDFNTIPGKALSLLVSGKFLKNHNLEEPYSRWISEQPVAKFTGYVHELFAPLGNGFTCSNIPYYKELTINKQFAKLVEVGKQGANVESTLLVVRDTSSSMTATATGCKMSAHAIAKGLAIYFSELLTGPFKNMWAEFNDTVEMHKFEGNTPVDMWRNDRAEAYGSTNLLSVARFFVKLKQEYDVPEVDFPHGALLISDGCFNSAGHNKTNFEKFREILKEGGFGDYYVEHFKLILWDIPNNYYGGSAKAVFDDLGDYNYYLSGYDPSTIAFILGTEVKKSAPKNAFELMEEALNQDILKMLYVPKEFKFKKKNGKKAKHSAGDSKAKPSSSKLRYF